MCTKQNKQIEELLSVLPNTENILHNMEWLQTWQEEDRW